MHDGGNNTYVPTTTFYSDFVEIAQPDNGKDPISYIQDPRNVGVTNNKAKDIWPYKPAGEYVTHHGSLYDRLGYALEVDELTHDGGLVSRIDLEYACPRILPDELLSVI